MWKKWVPQWSLIYMRKPNCSIWARRVQCLSECVELGCVIFYYAIVQQLQCNLILCHYFLSLSTSLFVSFILVHVSSWHKAGKHVSLDYAILAYLINSPKPYFIGNISKLTSKTKILHFTKWSILFYFSGNTCFVRNGALGSMWREGVYIYIYIYI